MSQKALSHISSCDTAYEMLSKLKAKFCPTEDICKIKLVTKFRNQLRSSPKSRNIEDRLSELERLYSQYLDRNLLEADSGIKIKDFLDTVSNTDPAFMYQWDGVISRGELGDVDFSRIIQHFQNWKLQRSQRSHGRPLVAFPATFQGQMVEETKENPGPKDDNKTNKKGRKPCLYGAK